MKIFSFLLLLTFSISILNANPPQKELNCHAELDSVQLIGNNYQQNELQREKIQKEYLFKPDSIWGTDLLGMIIGSDFYTYHNNHIGTPLFMTDLTGTKAWEAETDSFGQVEITTSTIENNIRLAGQYFDAETGLHYNWNRYYDPSTGRYISQDPIGFAGGISLYGYVGQNPIGGIDPTGLWVGIALRLAFKVLTSKPILVALGIGVASKVFRPELVY
jgi:RHS repeat-associated protein